MIDCSPEKTSEAAVEMLDRLEEKWEDDSNISDLQSRLKNHNWQNIYREINEIKNIIMRT